jgi:hypothetical protein
LALAYNFDVCLCVDVSGTPFLTPGTGTLCFDSWEALVEDYPNASYVELTPDGSTNLELFIEPPGDVVYVLGGDYGDGDNFNLEAHAKVKVQTGLAPGRGLWSFLAMAIVAYRTFKS